MKLPYQFYRLLEWISQKSRALRRERSDELSYGKIPPTAGALPAPAGGLCGIRENLGTTAGEGAPLLLMLAPEQLLEGDGQPRRDFVDSSLIALADSIRLHGLLHPITVRRLPGRRPAGQEQYAVVAGERRLRAMEILGRRKVPCILAEVSPEEAAALAIIENIHRQPLNPFEEADAAAHLRSCECPPLTAAELGASLSLSPKTIEKKLSLRCFSEKERRLLLAAALPEEALLAMAEAETREDRLSLLKAVCLKFAEEGSAAAFVRKYLASQAAAAKIGGAKRQLILGNIRIFYNTVDKAVSAVREAGIPAICRKEETADRYRITIEIPKEAEQRTDAPAAGELFHVEQLPQEIPHPEPSPPPEDLPDALRRRASRTVEIPALH